MKKLLCTAALLIPISAAAQPYSESMADCASLYQNMAQWSAPQDVDTLMYAAVQWHGAAVAQSAKEGHAMSDSAMWDKVDAKTAVWEKKGGGFFMTEEFRDWAGYCRSFAKHVDVAYKMPTN